MGRDFASSVLAVVRDRAGRRRWRWAVIALVGVFLCACSVKTQEQKDMEAALARLPGVQQVSTEIEANFSTVVVLTGDASAQQVKAVIEAFREQITAATNLPRRRVDIELRWPERDSSFKAGRDGLATAPEHAAQWYSLSRAFPRDEVVWTYQWAEFCCDAFGPGDLVQKGYTGVGDISVKPEAEDFRAVSATYRRMMGEFPEFADAEWEIGAWGWQGGLLRVDNRYPSETELSVWHRLNQDQSVPHSVQMTTRTEGRHYPQRPSIVMRLRSQNFDEVKRLTEQHIPIAAELGAPDVDYFATTDGSRSYDPDHELRITIGGCQYTDRPPSPAEQPFVDRYGKCPR
ncbi:hypothetical protein O3I_018670 [Nocardia brasiliensis ATCC 700358]|uniref:Uncharacterized protein n=1 Tax=Nocardia brasiliensis (strain ATCC 700358 / HUJEG-1) TaxID=1133849 RepID=K0EPM8_NOCB7|nr:hypothetical protein O3I_018670 [Nocardia brasiliensis ATCC 700358]